MACSSSSSLVLTAINAMLEDPSFRTGSKVAADALKSAQTVKKTGTRVKRIELFWSLFLPALALTLALELNFQ